MKSACIESNVELWGVCDVYVLVCDVCVCGVCVHGCVIVYMAVIDASPLDLIHWSIDIH